MEIKMTKSILRSAEFERKILMFFLKNPETEFRPKTLIKILYDVEDELSQIKIASTLRKFWTQYNFLERVMNRAGGSFFFSYVLKKNKIYKVEEFLNNKEGRIEKCRI